jgi:hypothetical protein
MNLSPANLEVLQSVRSGLVGRGALLQLSVEELKDVHRAEGELDGREYAEWAAHRLVEVLKINCASPRREVIEADLWVMRKLQQGYLVRREWLQHSYDTAKRLVGA